MRLRFARVSAVIIVILGVVAGSHATAYAAGSPILGGGSGFAGLEVDQWRAETAVAPFNLTVNYQAQGSTFGRNQFSAGQFDYGASDIRYLPAELTNLEQQRCKGYTNANVAPKCFVYVPVSAGGLAFMYNLTDPSGHRITDLKLTRADACKIFTGQITHWNDPELVANNPRLAANHNAITAVVRDDGAGESYVFSEFCLAVAPDIWHAFINQQLSDPTFNTQDDPEFKAGRPTSSWPKEGWGTGNAAVAFADGVANYVASPVSGPNAITYVAAGYAIVRHFPTALLQNVVGNFTRADDQTAVTVALQYATPVGDGTFNLNFNGPDPRAYFPSTYSYVLAQTGGFDAGKGATLAQFLCYAVTKGQADANPLGYARLSSEIVAISKAAIVQIPGAPSLPNCNVAGAPPPPPPPPVVGGGGHGGLGGAGAGSSSGGGGSGGAGRSGSGGFGSGGGALGAGATGTGATSATEGRARGGAGGSGSGVLAGGASEFTTTTIPTADNELQRALGAAPAATHSHTSGLWLLVVGALIAWGFSLLWARRRKVFS
jgi:ABC-type phosphate transport system substrate-binding protein